MTNGSARPASPSPGRACPVETYRRARLVDCRSRNCASRRLRSDAARFSSWLESASGNRRTMWSRKDGRCSRSFSRLRERSPLCHPPAPTHHHAPIDPHASTWRAPLSRCILDCPGSPNLSPGTFPIRVRHRARNVDRACLHAIRSVGGHPACAAISNHDRPVWPPGRW